MSYEFDNLLRDEREAVAAIGDCAEGIAECLSRLTGEQLAAWGDRIGDPMRTLLEMRSVAMLTRYALEDAEADS